MPLPSEAKGLEISQEDRAIGVVSSKLYWEYFRSGQHSLVIIAVICLCFITQGKRAPLKLSITFLASFFSAIMVVPDVWLSFLTKKLPEDQEDKTNLTIYGCLVGASFTFVLIFAYIFIFVSLRCSQRLHDWLWLFYKHRFCFLIQIPWEEYSIDFPKM